ncbi:MAG: hypothetical protein AAFZ01_10725 [Pseudomonadota bacterium]
MITLPKNEDVDITKAESQFTSAEAATALAREARETEARPGLSIHELKTAVREGRSVAAVSPGNVVPFRAVQLYRSMLSHEAVGWSQMARAARTNDDVRRQVGDFEVNVVEDDDAVFLTVTTKSATKAATMTLINDAGQVWVLALPEAIGDTQQLGFATGSDDANLLLTLMQDATTSIFMT